jgi:hypothetical protein
MSASMASSATETPVSFPARIRRWHCAHGSHAWTNFPESSPTPGASDGLFITQTCKRCPAKRDIDWGCPW